jgi:hypothetical protein
MTGCSKEKSKPPLPFVILRHERRDVFGGFKPFAASASELSAMRPVPKKSTPEFYGFSPRLCG